MLMDLQFEVSAGLKSVIGKDLITNDEVAIFELVKNSFDAGASKVQIYFDETQIFIVDNGQGMSLDDIKDKWLFVAYSSKSDPEAKEFRDLAESRRHFAGSKGIGRFSADRLGGGLELQSKSFSNKRDEVNKISVDWSLFERDQKDKFYQVPVKHEVLKKFVIPDCLETIDSGTAIKIKKPRVRWDRDRILHLKSALSKLINPFGSDVDGFEIMVFCPDENEADDEKRKQGDRGEACAPNSLVNGPVGNFIFSTLQEKTTFISVDISDGKITSTLTDRGEIVYRIRETNVYSELEGANFRCEIYYLNLSAKTTFARRMGLPSVQFGSVFLFRNGFRVYPIGERGDDYFGVDSRKQQGFSRFLGTRDIIGRLDVDGPDSSFKESSSRNQGLIDTAATLQLKDCFWEFCLKRLEKYVVPVSWVDPAEKNSEDLSRLLTDSGKARVTAVVAKLVDSDDVEILEFSKRLVSLLNERSSQFEGSINNLRAIAEKAGDSSFIDNLDRAEKRYLELKASEQKAIEEAEIERERRKQAEAESLLAKQEAELAVEQLEEEKKRALFLASISNIDSENILNMHHQITIYSADLKQQVENCLHAARRGELSNDDIASRLEQIAFLNQKILSVSKMAIKANFRLESEMISFDVGDYFEQYINTIASPYRSSGVVVEVIRNDDGLEKKFSPMDLSIVIDNLINNAKKADATNVVFKISSEGKNVLVVSVEDNGRGFSKGIDDFERVFEIGFSRTDGSGLGLYHVRQVLADMKGSILVDENFSHGAKFDLRISK